MCFALCCFTSSALIFSPLRYISPASSFRRPMSASASSVWPLPSTPAMPRISPFFTENDILRIFDSSLSPGAYIPSTRSATSSPTSRSTCFEPTNAARPSMSAASLFLSVSCFSTVATVSPARMIVIRSLISITSLSLWEIKMMLVPAACNLRITLKSSFVSWGVKTAVGSSSIMTCAPR